jgi:hypothetical protein
LVPVTRRSTSRLTIPPCLPLVASSTVSTDDLAVVTLGLPHPVVALVPGVSGASGGSQGATDIKVVGTRPQLGNDAGSLIRDLMMHSVITGVPGSAVLGDAAQPPGPRVPWVQGYLDYTCRALLTF